MESVPQNARYNSSNIQKEILYLVTRKVQNKICNEISNVEFYLIVDEIRDESREEHMTLVLRIVDKHEFFKKHLIDIVYVRDIAAATLKQEICSILSHHNLNI